MNLCFCRFVTESVSFQFGFYCFDVTFSPGQVQLLMAQSLIYKYRKILK